MTASYVTWCILRAEEALLDYDLVTAKNYLKLAKYWESKKSSS